MISGCATFWTMLTRTRILFVFASLCLHSWALVTFEAAVEYLRADPLNAQRRSQAMSSEGSTSRQSSTRSNRSLQHAQRPSSTLSPNAVSRPPLLHCGSNNSGWRGGALGNGNGNGHGNGNGNGNNSSNGNGNGSSSASGSSSGGNALAAGAAASSFNFCARERRVSLPAAAFDGRIASGTRTPGSPDGASAPSYFPRTFSIEGPSGGTTEDCSPSLSQDGFRIPGAPASASASSRRGSRTSVRPGSVLGIVGEGRPTSLAETPVPDGGGLPASRASSLRSRTTSLNAGSADLQIRPQIIVRSSRRPTTTSFSEHHPSSAALGRTSSSASVRVMGSPPIEAVGMARVHSDAPPLARTSPPPTRRRKSLDSWSALNFFGGASKPGEGEGEIASEREGGGAGDAVSTMTAVLDAGRSPPKRRPSQAESVHSDSTIASPHSTSSSSWLPWADWGVHRPSTPGSTATSASYDGVPSSSTFSSLPRSGSSHFEASASPPKPVISSGTVAQRRPASVRSASSVSSSADDANHNYSYTVGSGSSGAMSPSGSHLSPAASTTRKGRRHNRLLSATAGLAAPLPPRLDRPDHPSPSAEFAQPKLNGLVGGQAAGGPGEGAAAGPEEVGRRTESPSPRLSAAAQMSTTLAAAAAAANASTSSLHGSPKLGMGSSSHAFGLGFGAGSGSTSTSTSASAHYGYGSSSGSGSASGSISGSDSTSDPSASRSGFLPAFFRLHVPSPVHEIDNPLGGTSEAGSNVSAGTVTGASGGAGTPRLQHANSTTRMDEARLAPRV